MTVESPTPDAPATDATDATTAPEAPKADEKATPPWGNDFDPQRAWDTITRQRDSEKALKDRIAAFERAEQERADANKSELDKAIARAERAEQEAKAKARALALSRTGLSEDAYQFITAEDDEGIAKQAAALMALAGKKDDAQDTDGDTPALTTNRPKPGLKPGHGGDVSTPFDAAAIATAARQHI